MGRNERDEGFTLVELLVVVVIIGILTTLGIPVFTSARERGYTGAVNSDLRNAAMVMMSYHASEGRYPLGGEVSIATSPGVTITIALPVAPGDAQDFCLEGTHVNIGAVTATYDTRVSGLTSNGSC